MAKIFISYRRTDSASVSGRIYDRLVGKFGKENIFKDVDDIPTGVHFPDFIRDSLGQCLVELVIIGCDWLTAEAEDGTRRLDDPQDWVRQEIEMALSLGLAVIPVLVEGASMSTRLSLPESLRELSEINAIAVRNDPDFGRDIDRLLAVLEGVFIGQTRRSLQPIGETERTMSRNTESQWQDMASPTSNLLYSASMVSATDGWAVGSQGTMLHYTGLRWAAMKSLTYKPLQSVSMVSATEGWAVGGRTILHYTGGQWEVAPSPTTKRLSSVAMVSATEGWAVGERGRILHYAGGQWREVPHPTDDSLTSVSMVSATEGWAIGYGGTILHYIGGQWQDTASPTSASLLSVSMVSATEGWAVGSSGNILHYTTAT